MLIMGSGRCDILAFYSKWLINRIKDKAFYTRNPYNPKCIYKYNLEDIDSIIFCTKNPIPILKHLDLLNSLNPYFFITITPYKKDIENISNKNDIIEAVKLLSNRYGINSVSLRYDPIFLNDIYTKEYHYIMLERLLKKLAGYIDTCIISFIDIYDNVKAKGFTEVSSNDQIEIVKRFVSIANKYNIKIKLCAEDPSLQKLGCVNDSCISYDMLSRHLNNDNLIIEKNNIRNCNCVKTKDIGAYSCCPHMCRYCYANGYDDNLILKNFNKHNPNDLCIDGNPNIDDEIIEIKDYSIFNKQMKLDL